MLYTALIINLLNEQRPILHYDQYVQNHLLKRSITFCLSFTVLFITEFLFYFFII